jgi:hypothetical protein
MASEFSYTHKMSFFIKKNLKWNIYVGTKLKKTYVYIDVAAYLVECRHNLYISYRDGIGLPYWGVTPVGVAMGPPRGRNAVYPGRWRQCAPLTRFPFLQTYVLPKKKLFQPTHIGTWLSNVKFQWQIRCKETYIFA